ncbi:MAG: Uma2 family endonuclease [Hormoscilla sp. GM7CHS1pb]|nr:Uma2 family endonuclease [Hormoscilla sp. GM7CHS1pb]
MKILSYDPTLRLPTAEELPDSDDTPVDNELQNLIPNAADDILSRIWAQRDDWFWGVDMGIYYHPEKPALVPDGFLSIGVQRIKSAALRLSYVVWEEKGIVPILVMEVVSKTYGGEYDKKMADYAELGALYYVIYNPFCRPIGSGRRGRRSRHADHQPLEVYKLEEDQYRLLSGNPIWLPEIGLGIGTGLGRYRGRSREWVYWYDQEGRRYLASDELAEQERQRAQQAQQEVEQERQRAQQAQQEVEQERQRVQQAQQEVEQERQRAQQAQQEVEQERQRAQQEVEQERQRAQQEVEQERQRAQQAQQEVEQERQRAQQAQQEVEQERQRAQQEVERQRQRAERLAEYLRSQNIDPDQLM